MKTYQEYNTEIRRLRTVYNGSVKSYDHFSKYLKEHLYDKGNTPKEPVYLNGIVEENHLIVGSEYEYINKLEGGFAKSLREIMLIRLISNLEVFLIKVIRDIFLHRKDLFHKERDIEFKHSELLSAISISELWTKLINKECRNLQNQGFSEVRKYYSTTFNIDLNQSGVSMKYIEKLHDTRHLLVHRLGKIDSEYAHKYNSKAKSIEISESDFYEAINELKRIADFIKEKYEVVISEKENNSIAKESSKITLTINLLTKEAKQLLPENYSFLSGEKYLILKDMLSRRELKESTLILEINGHMADLKAFERSISNFITAGHFEITNRAKKVSPTDWFSKQEITFIKSELAKGSIADEKLTEISLKFKIAKSKVSRLIETLKRHEKKHSH